MMSEYYVIYIWCWITVFALIFLTFLAQLYFSYSKIDEILACLGDSEIVFFHKQRLEKNLFARSFFVLTIAGMLTFPEMHIRDGGFTRDEFEGVPSKLKFQLRALVYALFFLVVVCVLLWGVGECVGWLK